MALPSYVHVVSALPFCLEALEGVFESKASAFGVEGAGTCKESELGTQLSHAGAEVKFGFGGTWPCSLDLECPKIFAPFSAQQLHFWLLGR